MRVPGNPASRQPDHVAFPDRITGDGIGVEGKDYAVDHLLFCTGYRYDLPFLPNGIVTIEDNYISALYRDILPPSHPTLGMIGLPFLVVPFPLYAMQAKSGSRVTWIATFRCRTSRTCLKLVRPGNVNFVRLV